MCENGFLPGQLGRRNLKKKKKKGYRSHWQSFAPKCSCCFLCNFLQLHPDRPGSGCRWSAIKFLEWVWGLEMHLWFLAGPGLLVEIPIGLFPFAAGLLTVWNTEQTSGKIHLCDLNQLKLYKTLILRNQLLDHLGRVISFLLIELAFLISTSCHPGLVPWLELRAPCVGWSTMAPGLKRCWNLCAWSCKCMWIKHGASRNTGTVGKRWARISTVVILWFGKQVFANHTTLLNRLFIDRGD